MHQDLVEQIVEMRRLKGREADRTGLLNHLPHFWLIEVVWAHLVLSRHRRRVDSLAQCVADRTAGLPLQQDIFEKRTR